MTQATNDEASTGVVRGLQQIRRMILDGELLPGQKVHQGELAARLNMSRIPVREALSTLNSEGVLVHRPNTGFTVARFSGEDLIEIYLMRRVLEAELIRSLDLDQLNVDELIEIDDRLSSISPSEEPDEYLRTNREFHFYFFDRSPLKLVREEVARLWYKSTFYRSIYLSEVDASLHVHDDHRHMIDAVRDGDMEELIRVANAHRADTEDLVVRRLGASRPRATE
jgi:DNA-binding GntR family transcriptional regulator